MSNIFTRFVFLCRNTSWLTNALLVLAFLAMAIFVVLLPRKEQTLLNVKKKLAVLDTKATLPHQTSEDATYIFVSTFYSQLPSSAQLKEMQAFFFDQAAAKRLDVDTVHYQLEEQQDIPFSIYKMQVPLAGTYLEILAFVKKMLEVYPTLALTGISLSRDNAQTNLVDGDVEFSVYIKKDN